MDLSFKDQELTELSLAEKVFQCAQGGSSPAMKTSG